MTDNQWLQELKVGDEVYIPKQYGRGYIRSFVQRITPSQIVVTGGDKYRKKDGCSVGTGIWNSSRIYQPTEKLENTYKLGELEAQAIKLRDKLTIPQTISELESLISALKPFIKETTK